MECEKQEKAVRSEMGLANVTSFFTASGSKSNDVLVAEGAFEFHTMIHHSTMKCFWADSRVKT